VRFAAVFIAIMYMYNYFKKKWTIYLPDKTHRFIQQHLSFCIHFVALHFSCKLLMAACPFFTSADQVSKPSLPTNH